jgi:hypothetical protein
MVPVIIIIIIIVLLLLLLFDDLLYGLVLRVPGYRSRGPGSIPTIPDFLRSNGPETGSTQPRGYN